MPLGAPAQTVPKSGCSPVFNPMLAISAAEFGSTADPETSVFQGLSAGKQRCPCVAAGISGPTCWAVDAKAAALGSALDRASAPALAATYFRKARRPTVLGMLAMVRRSCPAWPLWRWD